MKFCIISSALLALCVFAAEVPNPKDELKKARAEIRHGGSLQPRHSQVKSKPKIKRHDDFFEACSDDEAADSSEGEQKVQSDRESKEKAKPDEFDALFEECSSDEELDRFIDEMDWEINFVPALQWMAPIFEKKYPDRPRTVTQDDVTIKTFVSGDIALYEDYCHSPRTRAEENEKFRLGLEKQRAASQQASQQAQVTSGQVARSEQTRGWTIW